MLCVLAMATIAVSCDSYEPEKAQYKKVTNDFDSIIDPNSKAIAERIDSITQKAFPLSPVVTSDDLYEQKMAQYVKTANEFKSSLGPNSQILAERIDDVMQKVFYTITNTSTYETDILVYDYATDEIKSVLPYSRKVEDYELCRISIEETKLVEDRLFLFIHSECMWRCGATGVFYINLCDNTLHYIESCDYAEFYGSSVRIHKMYYLGEQEGGGEKCESKIDYISTSSNDEIYAHERKIRKDKEKQMAEEWKNSIIERNRVIERTIKFDYTVYSDSKFVDHIGTLNEPLIYNMVHTKVITIPNNKVWVFERCYTSGYDSFHSPVLGYHRIKNGICENPYGPPIKNAQVLYPGQYMFSIKDICSNSNPGHRKATVVFTEKTTSKY